MKQNKIVGLLFFLTMLVNFFAIIFHSLSLLIISGSLMAFFFVTFRNEMKKF